MFGDLRSKTYNDRIDPSHLKEKSKKLLKKDQTVNHFLFSKMSLAPRLNRGHMDHRTLCQTQYHCDKTGLEIVLKSDSHLFAQNLQLN